MTVVARPLAALVLLLVAVAATFALAAPASAAPPEVPELCIPGMSPPIWDGAPDYSCYG